MDSKNLPYNDRIIFYGECIDTKDPMGLGRIRAILKSENTVDREQSINEARGVEEKDKWTKKDPFVVRPLMPVFINPIPKVKEYVHLVYSNVNDKSNKDKFYIGGVFSSLTTLDNEPYESSVGEGNLGTRNKENKKLRNPQTGEEFEKNNVGVYSLPEDISIDGRGSADIVVKNDTVLLRAGKFNGLQKPNVYPVANNTRAFLQLSKFDQKTQYGTPETLYKFTFKHKFIKLLVEYNIINPDNTANAYTGSINIYTLKPNEKTNTKNFDNLSDVEDEKSPLRFFNFTAEPKENVIKLINAILTGVSEGLIPKLNDFAPSANPVGPFQLDKGLSFPYYFRPQTSLYNQLTSETSSTVSKIFIGNLMMGVKAVSSDETPGYGLIYDETKKQSVPFTPEKNVVIPQEKIKLNNTSSLLGGDYVYLLSHKSVKKSTGKIDLKDSLYGITESMISDEIEPKTSSSVRGEELVELLNLIVQFLITHVHPYHGMQPNSQSLNGITADKLLEELRNANEKILNKYIRIN